jgi:two-component system sensor histidine kinase UhpB
MWGALSLRKRLFLPLGTMFAVALLLGGVSLHIFTTEQLVEETAPGGRSAKAVADSLNAAVQSSANPRQTLDAFVQALGTSEAIQFRAAGTAPSQNAPVDVRTPLGKVPQWFIRLLTLPDFGTSYPVMLGGERVGDIVFAPDLSADIFEKWVSFLAILLSTIVLTAATWVIAYFAAGSALRPLDELGAGLTRMRSGDYGRPIKAAGPPEIRRSCEEANELARTLDTLSHDNRILLRKIVSLQDDERRDLARELHDELGPLLFGIRASTIALAESVPRDKNLAASTESILQSVEALQRANRRILDHLRPLYVQELGLEKSVNTLLQNARSQAGDIALTSRIDPRLNDLDGLLAQTVYRVIQEGVTNVLRHAKASSMSVEAAIDGDELAIDISDDGVGFSADGMLGRGLTGMHERVRALSGTFKLSREAGKTHVRCRVPIAESAADAAS